MKKPVSAADTAAPAAPSPVKEPETTGIDHETIARHAYELWILRGSPIGSPEVDWLRAEEELNQPRPSAATHSHAA